MHRFTDVTLKLSIDKGREVDGRGALCGRPTTGRIDSWRRCSWNILTDRKLLIEGGAVASWQSVVAVVFECSRLK